MYWLAEEMWGQHRKRIIPLSSGWKVNERKQQSLSIHICSNRASHARSDWLYTSGHVWPISCRLPTFSHHYAWWIRDGSTIQHWLLLWANTKQPKMLPLAPVSVLQFPVCVPACALIRNRVGSFKAVRISSWRLWCGTTFGETHRAAVGTLV